MITFKQQNEKNRGSVFREKRKTPAASSKFPGVAMN